MKHTECGEFYFEENVWPVLRAERGLPADAKPTEKDYRDWFSSQVDHVYDMMRDRQ